MDIQDLINNMTPEQFEKVCVKLLKHMKPNPFKISGTRYVKDGGKDIIGTVDDIPYEIWAECKKHTRSLGLDDISKNVVLVISNKINELFFFSTSDITKNAQKHISIVAEKHDFTVAFHYGKKLYDEINMLFESNKTNSIKECKDELTIEYYLTSYKNTEKYKEIDNLILKRDNYFYIDIFLHNNSPKSINDIYIVYETDQNVKINIGEIDKKFNLLPFSDRFIQVKGEILNNRHAHRIPSITIGYTISNQTKKKHINCGTVDATQMIYFPLIGEEPNTFLLKKIIPILSFKDNTNSYLIDIKGESGNGKSRLIKEICSIGRELNYRIIQYDGIHTKDISFIKDLLCKLLYLPYNNGNISFSTENILCILKQRNSNPEFADAIYSFVFQSKNDEEIFYFVKQAVLNFLLTPLFNENYIVVIDNVQELNTDIIDVLEFLIKGLYENSARCIIVLSTNTEFIPERNKEKLLEFSTILDTYSEDFHISYICNELNKEDAKSLYIHALNTNNTYFIDKLIDKSGCRPFDIIMLIKYLQEEEIITWQGMSVWYISNFDKLDKFLIDIPDSSSKILSRRLEIQQKKIDYEYWKTFIFIIKALLYFDGILPIQFIEDMGISEDAMEKITHSLFIKYDEYKPTIYFFHDNIHRFFYYKKSMNVDIRLAKKIKRWFEENNDITIDNKDRILYKIYIDLSDFTSAKKHGLLAIRNNYSLKNYEEVSYIGRQLISNSYIILSLQEKFEIMYMIANSERERVNHDQGAKLFYAAYKLLHENTNNIFLSALEYNKFMHACVNSQINASSPELALNILETFEKSPTLNDFYKFIVHNRYAVAFLAIGDTDNACSRINKSINLAKQINNDYLLSISYSDFAFMHFNFYEDRNKVIDYFSKAFLKGCAPDDLNRRIELFQQNALCLCLNNDIINALSSVNKSIELGEQLQNTFLTIKAITLKSTIYAYAKEYEKAIDILNNAIMRCDEKHSLVGKIKAYTNMCAINLLQNNNNQSKEHIDIAFELFNQSNLSVVKHMPLLYNYITVYSQFKEYDEIYKIMSKFNNERILHYLDDIYYNNGSDRLSYGVLRLKNAVFNY